MEYDEGSNTNSLEEEDDDPVVKEIPIIVSKRLSDQLYVFQYPLRPNSRNDPLDVKRCFVKTENQEVKLEVELNTSGANFDVGKAEYIAQKVDGTRTSRGKGEEVYFENEILDKVEYISKKNVEDASNYAVGIYNGSEYHITPLKGILEFQPYYPHLDKNVKRKRDPTEEENAEDPAKPGPSSAELVSVKFARNDNGQWKNHEKSYRKLIEKSADEPWVECDWHSERSELSELEKVKLYAEDVKNNWTASTANHGDPIEYIRSLVPEDQEQKIVTPSLPSNVLSFNSLRALPLLDQCKLLLKDAKIIQYQQLVMLLAGCEGVTPDLILKTLPQVAVLVRGNWVVKSEILFPNKTLSAISGVPAEIMCRARDYILWTFTKNQFVERRKVSAILRIPAEELKDLFVGISRLRYNRGWELMLPIDIDFMSKHQEVVARQTAFWEQRAVQLEEFFKETGKEKRQRRKSKSVSEDLSNKGDADAPVDKNSKGATTSARGKHSKKAESARK